MQKYEITQVDYIKAVTKQVPPAELTVLYFPSPSHLVNSLSPGRIANLKGATHDLKMTYLKD